MNDQDSALLSRYVKSHDESAFAELVQRYLNLVYFAALRQVGQDTHRAEDVTQAVFTQLARKAAQLVHHQALAGWLHTTTRFVASETMRTDRRRQLREQEAHAMDSLDNDPTASTHWAQLRPIIDDTLRTLNAEDREAVLLRFFANLSHAQIGQRFNLSENTARMRVDRALEKLRRALGQRGVTSTAAALSTVLANQALASAPAGLAATTTSVALAGTANATTAAFSTAKIFSAMSSTKIALGTAAAISIAATAITWNQYQAGASLRREVDSLRRQAARLQAENQKLTEQQSTANGAALAAQRALQASAIASTSAGASETAGAAAKATEPGLTAQPASTDRVPVEAAAKKVGRDTPRDTARTLLWYIQGGDVKHAAELLTFEPAEKDKLKDFIDSLPEDIQDKYGTPAKLIAFAMSGSPRHLANVQVLSEDHPDDYSAVQHVRLEYKSGEVREEELKFHRDVDGWKQVVSPASVDRIIALLKRSQ